MSKIQPVEILEYHAMANAFLKAMGIKDKEDRRRTGQAKINKG